MLDSHQKTLSNMSPSRRSGSSAGDQPKGSVHQPSAQQLNQQDPLVYFSVSPPLMGLQEAIQHCTTMLRDWGISVAQPESEEVKSELDVVLPSLESLDDVALQFDVEATHAWDRRPTSTPVLIVDASRSMSAPTLDADVPPISEISGQVDVALGQSATSIASTLQEFKDEPRGDRESVAATCSSLTAGVTTQAIESPNISTSPAPPVATQPAIKTVKTSLPFLQMFTIKSKSKRPPVTPKFADEDRRHRFAVGYYGQEYVGYRRLSDAEWCNSEIGYA
jgi:hypothetical protein